MHASIAYCLQTSAPKSMLLAYCMIQPRVPLFLYEQIAPQMSPTGFRARFSDAAIGTAKG